MIPDWQLEEKDEQISQALLIKKLLVTPEDCRLRTVAENWLDEHKSYLPEEPKGYILKEFVDESKLGF